MATRRRATRGIEIRDASPPPQASRQRRSGTEGGSLRRRRLTTIGAGVTVLLCATVVLGQQATPRVFVSPNKGQTKAQQDADTAACQQWATQQAPPSQAPTGPGTHTRGVVGGRRAGRRWALPAVPSVA